MGDGSFRVGVCHSALGGVDETLSGGPPWGEGILKPVYVQLCPYWAPAWGLGGPVRIMHGYAMGLADRFDVHVLTGNWDHELNELDSVDFGFHPVRVQRFRCLFRRLFRRNVRIVSPMILIRLARIIRRAGKGERVVVHTFGIRGSIPVYASVLKALFPRRVLLVHSAFGTMDARRSLSRKTYDLALGRLLWGGIDVALAQNGHEVSEYAQRFRRAGIHPPMVRLVPLNVDPDALPVGWFDSGHRKDPMILAQTRRELGLPGDALVVLFLGRVHPQKGLDRVLEVFDHVLARTSGRAVLLIVGKDYGYRRALEVKIAKSATLSRSDVRFVDNVYAERFRFYFAADVFLGLPTIHEETMVASLEAMASGTPVVVSEEAEIPGLGSEMGLSSCLTYDAEVVADHVEAIWAGTREAGAAARQFVKSRHASARVLEELGELLQANLGSGGTSGGG